MKLSYSRSEIFLGRNYATSTASSSSANHIKNKVKENEEFYKEAETKWTTQ